MVRFSPAFGVESGAGLEGEVVDILILAVRDMELKYLTGRVVGCPQEIANVKSWELSNLPLENELLMLVETSRLQVAMGTFFAKSKRGALVRAHELALL